MQNLLKMHSPGKVSTEPHGEALSSIYETFQSPLLGRGAPCRDGLKDAGELLFWGTTSFWGRMLGELLFSHGGTLGVGERAVAAQLAVLMLATRKQRSALCRPSPGAATINKLRVPSLGLLHFVISNVISCLPRELCFLKGNLS